ncbi:unnamed protein product [Strongylus vulgaris]|uniref:Uncharacterized protein n=1 Tax=Strongylus vulgaris TaxID=40348 RepID=A0A3P7JB55_STRVU|nr:unnamed protein product [Strongylus vulgaris]
MCHQTPLLREGDDLSEFQVNTLCMRYGLAAAPTPNEIPLLREGDDLSEFQVNALCMRYGLATAPTPNENTLLTATSAVVREDLKCYEPNKRVFKRDIERAKVEVQKQYEAALKAIRDRRGELLAAKALLREGGFTR